MSGPGRLAIVYHVHGCTISFGKMFSYPLPPMLMHKSQLTHDKILTGLLKSGGRADIRIHKVRREAKNRQVKLRAMTELGGPAVSGL